MIKNLSKAFILEPVYKNYSWGSSDKIQKITGNLDYSDSLVAELWMGNHQNGEGQILHENDKKTGFSDLIASDPQFILGKKTSLEFDAMLPFLFKIISAEKPLSIQVHPDLIQAEEGYRKETEKGIDINSFSRNYKDPNHKPELLYALTDFTLMKGFRTYSEIVNNLKVYCPESCGLLFHENRNTIKHMFLTLLKLEKKLLAKIINEAVAVSEKKQDIISENIKLFYHFYQTDPGVLSPLFLNLSVLKPGEAVFVPAGELHAYIYGTAFELMANSDNVIRGGLTEKHIDHEELIKISLFETSEIKTVKSFILENEKIFPVVSKEFLFSEITVSAGNDYICRNMDREIELFFCFSGSCNIEVYSDYNHKTCRTAVNSGKSFIIPAGISNYKITGDSLIYKAAVNL